MNYLQRKDSKRLGKLREQYLLYVYKHHIYSALLTVNPPKEYKKYQALEYVSTHPKCVEEFLNSRKWDEKDRGIIKEWEKEQFGEYRRALTYADHFELYHPKSKRLYAACILNRDTAEQWSCMRPEVVVKGSIFPYHGIFVFDSTSGIDKALPFELDQAEEFYEQMLHKRNEEGVYVNETKIKKYPLPDRSANADIYEVILDFYLPVIRSDFGNILMCAKRGWNLALHEDEARLQEIAQMQEQLQQYVYFFKRRKEKYFADITNEIKKLEAIPEGEGELKVVIEVVK